MGVTPDARALLGAYALDAVDDDEAAAVAELVAEDEAADRELHRLRGAAAWIGATEALAPPRDLRAALLQRATPVPEEVRIYRMAMARHEELLDSLPGGRARPRRRSTVSRSATSSCTWPRWNRPSPRPSGSSRS